MFDRCTKISKTSGKQGNGWIEARTSRRMLPAVLGLLLLAMPASASASVITLTIIDNVRETYSPGDVLVVEIVVKYTHRICTINIEETRFTLDGLKVVAATPWTSDETGQIHKRKLRVEVLGDGKDYGLLAARRKCDKEGGFACLRIAKMKRYGR